MKLADGCADRKSVTYIVEEASSHPDFLRLSRVMMVFPY